MGVMISTFKVLVPSLVLFFWKAILTLQSAVSNCSFQSASILFWET